MESLLGLQALQTPLLASLLSSWPAETNDVIDLVVQAETLSDLDVGVTRQLLELGNSGRVMAEAIDQATAEILGHKLTITNEITPLQLAGVGQVGLQLVAQPKDGDLDGPPPSRPTDHFLSINDASPSTPARVDQVVALIRADTSAGREPADRFVLLRWLVGHEIASADPGAIDAAVSMLVGGLPAAELEALFANGLHAVLLRIADALALGHSPTEAGLHVSLFSDIYVEWHIIAAERDRMQAQIDFISATFDAISSGELDNPDMRIQVQRWIKQLDSQDPVRQVLIAAFAAQSGNRLGRAHRSALKLFENDLVAQLQAAIDAEQFDLHLGTLGAWGPVLIGADGELSVFDAINEAAAIAPSASSSFVGVSYAASYEDFDGDQGALAVERLGQDQIAATDFFRTLGAHNVLEFVGHLIAARGSSGLNPGLNPVVAGISTALGLASGALGAGYARDLINDRPTPFGVAGSAPVPEWLFGHGDFDPGFLVAGAAASVALHGGGGGISQLGLDDDEEDPRTVMLERIASAGLGAELVHELDRIGTVEAFVWSTMDIEQSRFHLSSGACLLPDETMPLVSTVILQAGADNGASDILIGAAGSRIGELHIDVANGISALIAAHMPRYINAPLDSPVFRAIETVFTSGAGVDIYVATNQAIIDHLSSGFESGDSDWHQEQPAVYGFAGRVDGLKHRVFHNAAALRDQANDNTDRWIGHLANGTSLLLGGAGLLASGGIGLAIAAGGGVATVGGWIGPELNEDSDNVERFLTRENDELRSVDDDRSDGLALFALAHTESLDIGGGTGSFSISDADGRVPVLELRVVGQPTKTWQVDFGSWEWIWPVRDALADAQATLTYEEDFELAALDVLSLVGNGLFREPYDGAFAEVIGDRHD